MKIGVLTHNYPRFLGDFSGVFVEALCIELARQGQQVAVWAPYDPAYDSSLPRTVHVEPYRYIWPDRFHRLGYMRSMRSDIRLRAETYLLSPAMFAAGVATLMRRARRWRPDVLHAHWLLPNGFIAAMVSRRLSIPLVISIPGSDAQVAGMNPLFRAMARFAFRQADLLTANSEALRESIVTLGAEPAKFDMIIYGVDPDALHPSQAGVAELRSQLKIPEAAVILLCVGRMVPKKGFDVLLHALATAPLATAPLATAPVYAVMVGEGDGWLAWQRLAVQLGVEQRLRWVGNVPNNQIGVYYNLADLLVMPSVSRPADGLNVCVLDAMSCAKAVVGSDVAGNPLAIVHEETGLIVPEQDVAALAQALSRLVGDEATRLNFGKAGRWRIERELGWPVLAKRYIDHFSRLQRSKQGV